MSSDNGARPNRRLGVGFIGSGFNARFHMQAFRGVRDADVVGAREALHRGEVGLFGEEQVDRRQLGDRHRQGISTWTRPSTTRTA